MYDLAINRQHRRMKEEMNKEIRRHESSQCNLKGVKHNIP